MIRLLPRFVAASSPLPCVVSLLWNNSKDSFPVKLFASIPSLERFHPCHHGHCPHSDTLLSLTLLMACLVRQWCCPHSGDQRFLNAVFCLIFTSTGTAFHFLLFITFIFGDQSVLLVLSFRKTSCGFITKTKRQRSHTLHCPCVNWIIRAVTCD